MRRTGVCVAVVALCAAAPLAALYDVNNKGDWPKTWPKELEPLRKQSRTLVGPMAPHRHFAIRFNKREDMEAAWPHLLKVKSKGAPIILVRGENFFLGDKEKAGVVVHCPPLGQANDPAIPADPIPSQSNPRMTWLNANYIELVVDGVVVDLNRLPLPADTPIVDERFKQEKAK